MAGPLVIPTPIPAIDVATVAETGVQMQMPVRIGPTDRSLWLLPYEPLVAVRARNVITRRMIAKYRKSSAARLGVGSVKELWAMDDWEIVLTGLLHDHANPDALPTAQIARLNDLRNQGRSVAVSCALFEALGIARLAIESLELPPTAGIGYQSYVLRGFSDQDHDLFIDK